MNDETDKETIQKRLRGPTPPDCCVSDDAIKEDSSTKEFSFLAWGLKPNGFFENTVLMRDSAIDQILKWRDLR